MIAKLQRRSNRMTLRPDFPWKLAASTPPLLYANLDFDLPGISRDLRVLLDWNGNFGHCRWPERRTIAYLKTHQPVFRRTLEWITNRAETIFDEEIADSEDSHS